MLIRPVDGSQADGSQVQWADQGLRVDVLRVTLLFVVSKIVWEELDRALYSDKSESSNRHES